MPNIVVHDVVSHAGVHKRDEVLTLLVDALRVFKRVSGVGTDPNEKRRVTEVTRLFGSTSCRRGRESRWIPYLASGATGATGATGAIGA